MLSNVTNNGSKVDKITTLDFFLKLLLKPKECFDQGTITLANDGHISA